MQIPVISLKFKTLYVPCFEQFFAGIEEAVIRNIQACKEFSNTVKTAYGPNGMNKIIINHFDKLFLTSDCGTIVRELEVQHPAAKPTPVARCAQQRGRVSPTGINCCRNLRGDPERAALAPAAKPPRLGQTAVNVLVP